MRDEQLKLQLSTADKRLLGRKAAKCSTKGCTKKAMYVLDPVDAETRNYARVVAYCRDCENQRRQDV